MKKSAIVLFGLLLLLLQPASGQFTPQRAPELQNQETVMFLGTWGSAMGPYRGQIVSDPAQPQITLYCVDNFHFVGGNRPNPWTVNVSSVDGSNDMALTRLGGVGTTAYGTALQRYQQSAFLASMYNTTNRSNWTGIQAAIWTIMARSPDVYSSYATQAAPWLTMATSAMTGTDAGLAEQWNTFNFAEWSVLTDVNAWGVDDAGRPLYTDGGNQEHLVRNVVPEPTTVVLLLSGLVLVGFVARRRIQESDYS